MNSKIKFTKDDTLAVKGAAILFLLQYHNFFPLDKFDDYDVSFYPFSQHRVVLLTRFLKICVAMFAFLSAYGLTLSLKKYSPDSCITGRQYTHYVKTRLPKLMWGFWFMFVFSSAMCLFLKPERFSLYFTADGIRGKFIAFYHIIVDFLGLSCLMNTPTLCGTWWYMSLAIFIVLVVPFAARMEDKFGFFVNALLCIFIPRVLITSNVFNIGQNGNMIRWMFATLLGVAAARHDLLVRLKAYKFTKNNVSNKLVKFAVLTPLLMFFGLSYIFLNEKSSNFSYEYRDGFIPVFVIYYLYEFVIDIPIVRNILIFIGKHSMNIFYFSTFIRGIIFADFIYSFRYWLLIDLVLLVLSLGVSIVVELIKKYSGYDRLLNKIEAKIESKYPAQ